MAIATIQLPDGRIADIEVPNGATEEDLNNFLSSQFSDQKQQEQTPQEDSFLQKAAQFAMGVPQGLGNKFVGAVQTATNAVGAGNTEFAKNLAKGVSRLKQEQARLSPSERAGVTGGQILSDVVLSPVKGLGITGAAATSGAISGLTAPLEESGTGARLKQVAGDAALGAGFGKGLELAGKGVMAAKEGVGNIYKGIKASAPEELQAVSRAIKNKSSALFSELRDSGSLIRPQAAGQIVSGVEKALVDSGRLNPRLHGDTLSVVSALKESAESGKFDLEQLHQFTQELNDVVKKNTDLAGHLNPDAFKATQALNKIDEYVKNFKPKYLIQSGNVNAPKILQEAKAQWGKARKLDRITTIIEKADGDPNRIKALTKSFVANKKNLMGFSSLEKEALRNAAKNSTGEGILKMFGKFGLDLGSSFTAGNTALPAFTAGAVGFGQGMSAGGATLAAGTVARQTQKYLARGKLDDAVKLIMQSGDPAREISKVGNRKLQQKLLNRIVQTGAATLNN